MREVNYFKHLFISLIFILFSCKKDDSETPLLSDENSIINLSITSGTFSFSENIGINQSSIDLSIPESINLSDINLILKTSQKSYISPSPNDISDFSSPIKFIVTSESGIPKEYIITLKKLLTNFNHSCVESNASKWLGGDNRNTHPDTHPPYNRNVGTGQAVIPEKDLNILKFGTHLSSFFYYDNTHTRYDKNVTLKLNIRNENGSILYSKDTIVSKDFTYGFVYFDLSSLNIILKKNTKYIFTWYLVDGINLGISTGNSGNTDETPQGLCFGGGYSGESNKNKNTTLENWDIWYEHSWNFKIDIIGKE